MIGPGTPMSDAEWVQDALRSRGIENKELEDLIVAQIAALLSRERQHAEAELGRLRAEIAQLNTALDTIYGEKKETPRG